MAINCHFHTAVNIGDGFDNRAIRIAGYWRPTDLLLRFFWVRAVTIFPSIVRLAWKTAKAERGPWVMHNSRAEEELSKLYEYCAFPPATSRILRAMEEQAKGDGALRDKVMRVRRDLCAAYEVGE